MDRRDFCIARPLRMATMRIMINSSLILCWFFCFGISYAADTLRPGEGITDGEFLESSGQVFRLQFFSPGASTNRYLGIKYMGYNAFTVWPANPENPLPDTSGVLNLTQDGNLVITDRLERSFTINSQRSNVNASAVLLDSGNLVLKAGDEIVWQSFDHPSDTLLPGMKLGRFDLKTGQPYNLSLTSWLSPEVLAPGAFTLGVDPNNTKQLVVWRRGVPYWRSGTWNGYNFSYFPDNTGLSIGFSRWNFSYLSNENETYFTLTVSNDTYGWIEMHSIGQIDQYVYNRSNVGTILASAQCNDNELDTRSKGCVIPKSSGCSGGDVFPQKTGFMDGWEYLNDLSLGISDCREICVRNCSCNAYASARTDGTACKFSRAQNFISGGQDMIYIRNNTSVDKGPPRKKQLWLTVGAPVISLSVISLISLLCYLQRRGCFLGGKDARNRYGIRHDKHYKDIDSLDELGGSPKLELSGKKGHELPLFNFSSIEIATDHFSNANKLGQGGFGPVYKGRLAEGKEIAVKRLSRSSKQGVEEFKNEVALISKLQHRNLVRLLGCCIEGEERILIYEYLPNNSLDSFLFDATKRGLLDWKRRVCIIEGIAQGLLYLHKYSRLRIIHRDLKTSNILLDHDMNPKISDFGTARIFEENEHQANTIRIVGTYGYMSPEYAMDGLFSEKSDVFSFGVMMLEIISGKKNTGFYESNRTLNLLGYAWDLYKDGRYLELMDPVVEETCSGNEVMRCFQVGLLCVQESAVDRPTMALVVSMLSNESITLPTPKQPAFSNIVGVRNTTLPENQIPCSINDVTVTEIEAR